MGATRLCVTVTGQTMAELRRRRDEVSGADLVELRLDTVADPSAAAALEGRRLPVILTCRPEWEGGHFRGSEEERYRLLQDAQELGAEYVDVEWNAGFTGIVQARGGRGVVLSMHDFQGLPPDLPARARAMRATGAEVIKVAVMAARLTDNLALRSLSAPSQDDLVVIAMGDAGVPSRVLASRFGSRWTYVGNGVAPGQLPLAQLRDEFSFRRISAQTAIYGVVGRPVMHSLSPAMHNAAFKAERIDAVYLPLAAADFDDFLTFADGVGVAGASVTSPFKLAAFERAVESDQLARRLQAVNTLRRGPHGWHACNTDVAGFLDPLEARMPLHGKRVTVLGAGGAARAIVEALNGAGARVAVSARRRERAAEIARRLSCTVADWPPPPGSWDILVNATPVGTVPHVGETPLPGGPFDGQLVYDLVYNPPETALLRDALTAGCDTIGGLDMLVAQAQRQFRWWTGVTPAAGVMRAAARSALQNAAGMRRSPLASEMRQGVDHL
jgi:3-dehydroquinate dehydratase/shikimate dehydrogenase